ncbi:RhoGAP domain [Popillia japonica]|uniref:RhoGAP domain n=1 Tax=Popillia japonica TaxID=7064 RepID=A0AAW1MDF8_POPJA
MVLLQLLYGHIEERQCHISSNTNMATDARNYRETLPVIMHYAFVELLQSVGKLKSSLREYESNGYITSVRTDDQISSFCQVEQARDFLLKAGLADLSNIFQEGNEITDAIVNDSVRKRYLNEKQAQTVRARVRTLNKTLANRKPRRKQRQDIRDIAWNVETSSTGSRSRSATPDSLDSVGALNEELTSDDDLQLPALPLDSISTEKGKLKLSSSEPLENVFQRQGRENVAHLDSNNVVLKGYYPIEEKRIVNPRRERSGSDPAPEFHLKQFHTDSEGYLSCSPTLLACSPATTTNPLLSFDELIKAKQDEQDWHIDVCDDVVSIDSIKDSEYQYLKPLLWVEVTALFDYYDIATTKRKPSKRKRGNVFNVNLSTLVMRDMPNPLENTMVPQIYQLIINQIVNRCIREDGLLRIGGHRQKLEQLCNDIERHFYSDRAYVERALSEAPPHCLTGVLKKLLRDLPDSMLTMELFDMFYKTNLIPTTEDKIRALNLLILLLPVEHRNTFRYLVNFFNDIAANEEFNRMSVQNIAMIVAPSFFLPRILSAGLDNDRAALEQKENLSREIRTAAICCNIMQIILKSGESLWMIPNELLVQARETYNDAQSRRGLGNKSKKTHPTKKKLQRSNTQYEPGAMLSPKISRDYVY